MVLRLKWTHSFPAGLQSSQQGGVLISAKSDTKKKTPTQSHLFVPYLFLEEDLQPHHTGWALNLMFCVSLAVQTPTGESLPFWTCDHQTTFKLPAELLADHLLKQVKLKYSILFQKHNHFFLPSTMSQGQMCVSAT